MAFYCQHDYGCGCNYDSITNTMAVTIRVATIVAS